MYSLFHDSVVYKWQTFYLCSASVSATYSRSLVSESIICLLEGPSCLWVWSQQRPDRGCWCGFLSLTGNCRSELKPPDEHCGTLPSAASRYDPPATHNRSISDKIENIMRAQHINSAFLNSILLRQILWLGSERFDLLKKRDMRH